MNFYAIDFGHTNYKIAFIENGKATLLRVNGYHDGLIADELSLLKKETTYKKILCCSVLNENILNSLIRELPENIKNRLEFFSSKDCEKYISPAYKKNVNRLGVDRALNLVGASYQTKNDLIVIDAGTATTIDYLDSTKKHIGGIILPGKKIIDNAFFEILDFNFFEEDLSEDIFSKNTRSCIENGSILSAYGAINNVLEKMIAVKKSTPSIYVTGGNAQYVIDNCNYPIIHVESLLFDGLVVLGR